jgi:hypothetical protein
VSRKAPSAPCRCAGSCSLDLAKQLWDRPARVAALNNLALATAFGGDPEGAQMLFEEALGLCVAQGDRHREAALHNNLADLLRLRAGSRRP